MLILQNYYFTLKHLEALVNKYMIIEKDGEQVDQVDRRKSDGERKSRRRCSRQGKEVI